MSHWYFLADLSLALFLMSSDMEMSENASTTFEIVLAEYLHLSGVVSSASVLYPNLPQVSQLGVLTLPQFPRCRSFHLFREILFVTTQAVVCILLSFRIWVIHKLNKGMFAFLSIASMILVGLASPMFGAFFGEHSSIRVSGTTGEGCHSKLEFITSIRILYYVVVTLANLANIFTFYFTGLPQPFMRGGLSTLSSVQVSNVSVLF
ncbi:hypothetical protein K435DRAFT_812780 [Dendrothele bispora CBS 962.96]|uniref:Uncharacterized protein n=1 Tax=Dendrothele bispora (strain CBS 962.96) TaxID=1314807 RepID=A0A4S8KN49_DENBC|nr:hypothetical protein K435DRAFT_812780 [Dendrothele bispora CBS 962.96]